MFAASTGNRSPALTILSSVHRPRSVNAFFGPMRLKCAMPRLHAR
jgi:hypothetical protein